MHTLYTVAPFTGTITLDILKIYQAHVLILITT